MQRSILRQSAAHLSCSAVVRQAEKKVRRRRCSHNCDIIHPLHFERETESQAGLFGVKRNQGKASEPGLQLLLDSGQIDPFKGTGLALGTFPLLHHVTYFY